MKRISIPQMVRLKGLLKRLRSLFYLISIPQMVRLKVQSQADMRKDQLFQFHKWCD